MMLINMGYNGTRLDLIAQHAKEKESQNLQLLEHWKLR